MKFKIYSDGKAVGGDFSIQKFREDDSGIFETMRVYHGRIFLLEDHLVRFLESAKTVGYFGDLNRDTLKSELIKTIEAFGQSEAIVRLTLMNGRVFTMIGERRLPKRIHRQGIALRTSPVKRAVSNAAFPEAKSCAYQNALMASYEPKTDKIYEWLFLDKNHYVTEVCVGNIFMITRDGSSGPCELWTPPVLGILNGVTRRFVIKCASLLGMAVSEKFLTRHDIFNAEEAFLTNTSWEILPVRELDGRLIGTCVPGSQTLKLHQIFKRKVEEECRKIQ